MNVKKLRLRGGTMLNSVSRTTAAAALLAMSTNISHASEATDLHFTMFFAETFLTPIAGSIRDDEDALAEAALRRQQPSFSGGFGITRTETVSRGTLATENPPGVLVNPALSLSSALDGLSFDFSYSDAAPDGLQLPFMFPESHITPSRFVVTATGSFLDGHARIENQPLPNGIGITGVGVTPGVFINSPTDIQSASWDVEQNRGAVDASLGGPIWKDKVWFFGTHGGIRGGAIDHSERTSIWADTPAFGANSAFSVDQHTQIDDRFIGGYVSAGGARAFSGAPDGATFFIGGGASVGFDYHNADVRDAVSATGLGGALNFNQQIDVDVNETILTAGANAFVGLSRGNFTLSLSASADYGKHIEYRISRPDSAAVGMPLPTAVDIEPVVSFTGKIRAVFKY